MAAPAAVELKDITKRFPGVIANDGIQLKVERGEIHAVVGENGAGKSTLMKILYGMQQPDEGEILVDGEVTTFGSPREAIDVGIGMVHQHFMLADNLTVLENVVLGSAPARGPRILSALAALVPGVLIFLAFVRMGFAADGSGLSGGAGSAILLAIAVGALLTSIWAAYKSSKPAIDFVSAREAISRLSGAHGIALDTRQLVEELSVGEKQRVEIVKVLYRGARILILDEPTSVLVPQEVEELFGDLRALVADGVTIIFISHKLDEVLAIADTITVVRAGKTIATVKPEGVSARDLAELMVGSELPTAATTESTVTDVLKVSVKDLGARGEGDRWLIEDVSFDIHKGEILGVAGVEGNGQQELVDLLLGIRAVDTGSIELSGENIAKWSTRERREAGMGFIPADRHGQGLLLPSPLWENAMLGHQSVEPFSNGPMIDRKGAVGRTNEIIEGYDVRTPGVDTTAKALSGGNQQKFIVGREMTASPSLLLASHPTRGIDVGAQAVVWQLLRDARAKGLAVLLISADLEELIGLSDTLMVILRGRMVATLDPATVTAPELGSYMTGAQQEEVAS